MGRSWGAELVYGHILGRDDEFDHTETLEHLVGFLAALGEDNWPETSEHLVGFLAALGEDNWPELIAARRGIVSFWDKYTDEEYDNLRDTPTPEFIAKKEEWFNQLNQIRAEFPLCDIDFYGYEYSGKMIVIKESVQSCDYAPESIDPDTLIIKPSWNKALRNFTDELGITFVLGHPGWYLTAYYG